MNTNTYTPDTYAVSKYHDKLMHPDAPDAAYFMHSFGDYELEGRILYNESHDRPWVLSIHGARSDYSRADPVSCGLQSRGYSLLTMTMSGHSEAQEVDIHATSLGNNIAEAEAFFGYLDPNKPKALIAYSLGGTPALKVLGEHLNEVDRLILFYPGIYSVDSYDKPYGEQFSAVLHTPYSYRNNDTMAILEQFKGKVVVVKGEYDGLDPVAYGRQAGQSAGKVIIGGKQYYSPIPKEVFDMITATVPSDRCSLIEIPGCDHPITPWMKEHPTESQALLDRLAAFLRE